MSENASDKKDLMSQSPNVLEQTQHTLHQTLELLDSKQVELFKIADQLAEKEELVKSQAQKIETLQKLNSNAVGSNDERSSEAIPQDTLSEAPSILTGLDLLGRPPHPSLQGGDCFC